MYLANRAPELFPGAVFAVAHCNFALRGEESDRDILAAADLFESAADDSRTAEDWLMFLEGQHPEWVTRGAKGGFHSYGMGPFEMPNPEWGVLLDLCAMPLCETSYQRFRNADGGFENGQFMTRPELRFDSDLGLDEHTWEEWLRITFVFKPTGFAYRGIRVDEEDASWFHPMEDHSANQRISGTDAAHMLRLGIESVMESIREGCA